MDSSIPDNISSCSMAVSISSRNANFNEETYFPFFLLFSSTNVSVKVNDGRFPHESICAGLLLHHTHRIKSFRTAPSAKSLRGIARNHVRYFLLFQATKPLNSFVRSRQSSFCVPFSLYLPHVQIRRAQKCSMLPFVAGLFKNKSRSQVIFAAGLATWQKRVVRCAIPLSGDLNLIKGFALTACYALFKLKRKIRSLRFIACVKLEFIFSLRCMPLS